MSSDVLARFVPVALNADQQLRAGEVRREVRTLAETLTTVCPPGRELALALTKLEECQMWAIRSIAVGQR